MLPPVIRTALPYAMIPPPLMAEQPLMMPPVMVKEGQEIRERMYTPPPLAPRPPETAQFRIAPPLMVTEPPWQ